MKIYENQEIRLYGRLIFLGEFRIIKYINIITSLTTNEDPEYRLTINESTAKSQVIIVPRKKPICYEQMIFCKFYCLRSFDFTLN